MKFKMIILLLLTGSILFSNSNNFIEKSRKNWPNITMINKIQFIDHTYAPDYPGCSFLIDIGDEILAVTCKHSLWTGKNDKMNNISLNSQVKEWRMQLKNDSTQYIIVDKLINENTSEPISEWNTDKDYLIFTIKENHSNIQPLQLNNKPLEKNEKLYTIGWSFRDKDVPQQLYISNFVKYHENAILVQDSVRQNLAGASGSPVINSKGKLSGIVSTWKFDNATKNWFPAPCSIDYLIEILFDYWLKKNDKPKTIDSFNKFTSQYSHNNSGNFYISDNLFINIFFNDWYDKNKVQYPDDDDFEKWQKEISKEFNQQIELSSEFETQLHFNSWINKYLESNSTFDSLDEIQVTWQQLAQCSESLSQLKEHTKAIEIMDYTVKRFPNFGQVYYFRGEVYRKINNIPKAIADYKTCLKKYQGYPFAEEKLKELSK